MTVFSRSAWLARSNCRTSSPIRRCRGTGVDELIVAATARGEVFWVEGMRISERFKLTTQTIRRLQWRWKRL